MRETQRRRGGGYRELSAVPSMEREFTVVVKISYINGVTDERKY